MLTRILLFLAIVAAAAGVGYTQPAPDLTLPEPCRAQPSQGLPALEKRKESLEREIAQARKASTGGAQDEASMKLQSKSQTELLEILFKVECLKIREAIAKAERAPAQVATAPATEVAPAPPPPPETGATAPSAAPAPAAPSRGAGAETGASRSFRKVGSGGAMAESNAIEVTTYFATNRGRSGQSDPARAYNANVAALSYGRALVSIPSSHAPGSLELPSIWRLQFQPDPMRHFVLKDATALSANDARVEMTKRLEDSKQKALLIYVHGYNMTFAETAMRTAQLAYDLNFPGVPFFFSWPSAAQVTGYLRDVETAQLSEDAFDRVLDDLAQLPVNEIYVIAHSMGSRLVTQVLRSRVDKGKSTAHLSELLLAAPDINAELFRAVIAPRLKALQGTQTTVYASSSDLALLASKAVNGYPRVGETAGGIFIYPGLETIDASRASMAVRAFGHSYLTDSAAVLKDIGSLLRQKLSAKQRGLVEAGASPNVYWALR